MNNLKNSHFSKLSVLQGPSNTLNNKNSSLFQNRIGTADAIDDSGEWLTTDEAAEYLRISPASLRNLSSSGRVPYYKWQRRNRYKKNDLRDLLLANRRGRIIWE